MNLINVGLFEEKNAKLKKQVESGKLYPVSNISKEENLHNEQLTLYTAHPTMKEESHEI